MSGTIPRRFQTRQVARRSWSEARPDAFFQKTLAGFVNPPHNQVDIAQPQSAFVTLLVKHESGVDARRLVPDWDSVDEALREANVIIWRSRGAWGVGLEESYHHGERVLRTT